MDNLFINETKWSKMTFINDGSTSSFISKFQTEETTITLNELRRYWQLWNYEEKCDFVLSFAFKRPLLTEDYEILRFLMQYVDYHMLSCIASSLTELPEKKQVFYFLEHKLSQWPINEPLTFMYQAIGLLNDIEGVPLLYHYLYQELRGYDLSDINILPEDTSINCIYIFVALYRIERKTEYLDKLHLFLEHPNVNVRNNVTTQLLMLYHMISQKNNIDKAIEGMEILYIFNHSDSVTSMLIEMYQKANKWNEALEITNNLIQKENYNNDPWYYLKISMIFAKFGQYESAIKYADKFLQWARSSSVTFRNFFH